MPLSNNHLHIKQYKYFTDFMIFHYIPPTNFSNEIKILSIHFVKKLLYVSISPLLVLECLTLGDQIYGCYALGSEDAKAGFRILKFD